jgi:hypothetical protein
MEGNEMDIDYNKVIAEVINSNIKSLCSLLGSIAGKAEDEIRIRIKSSFTKYYKTTIKKYSKVKTVLYRVEPKDLNKLYVPLDIECGEIKLNSVTFNDVKKVSNCTVITGTAGSGKSTLMKHLFLSSFQHSDKLPIFVELRDIKEDDLNVVEFIYSAMQNNNFNLDIECFNKMLSYGKFAFFLDGFDEIPIKIQKNVATQIVNTSSKHHGNIFVITSREDMEFSSWNTFHEFSVMPLTKEKAKALIKKLEYNDATKKIFSQKLEEELYDKHISFLSNPLLLTIMLMTFDQFAEIPTKINLFYSQVFDTLYYKHDATKQGFKRDMYTKLAKDDFIKVLSCFCLLTFLQQQYTFSTGSILPHLRKSRDITGVDFKEDDYLEDLLKSLCILVKDGLNITFTHRSFQEYYAAEFISSLQSEKRRQLVNKVSPPAGKNVLLMLHSINKECVELDFVIPFLKKTKEEIQYGAVSNLESYKKFTVQCFDAIEIVFRNDNSTEKLMFSHNDIDFYECLGMVKSMYIDCFSQRGDVGIPDMKLSSELIAMKGKEMGEFIHFNMSDVLKNDKALSALKEFSTNFYYSNSMNEFMSLLDKLEKRHNAINESIDNILLF